MKFVNRKVHLKLSQGETLISAHILCRGDDYTIISLTNVGQLLQQGWNGGEQKFLMNVSEFIDLEMSIKIYSFGSYIAVVNNRGIRGVIINIQETDWVFPLLRGDYCVGDTSYPFAFFTKKKQTHIIHGTDWNRVDITNLETGVCLTDRVVSHDPPTNYMDFFHGYIHVSPNQKSFVNTGWHWHPVDWIYAWDITKFLKTYELGGMSIERPDRSDDYGCVWDRPMCFINNTEIALGFNQFEGGYGETKVENGEQQCELLIQDVTSGEVVRRFPFNHFAFQSKEFEVMGELYFDKNAEQFITFSDTHDLTFTNKDGIVIARKPFHPVAISTNTQSALMIHDSAIEVLSWVIGEGK